MSHPVLFRKARPIAELTPRQHAIAKLLSNGYSNKEIAKMLGIGVYTIKQALSRMFFRVQQRNRVSFVIWYKERFLDGRGEVMLQARNAGDEMRVSCFE